MENIFKKEQLKFHCACKNISCSLLHWHARVPRSSLMDSVPQLFRDLLSRSALQESSEMGRCCSPLGSLPAETDLCWCIWLRRRAPSGLGSAHIGSLKGGLSGGGEADRCSCRIPGDCSCSIVQMFVYIRSLIPPRVALEGWTESGFGGTEDLDLE